MVQCVRVQSNDRLGIKELKRKLSSSSEKVVTYDGQKRQRTSKPIRAKSSVLKSVHNSNPMKNEILNKHQ